jgi:hypothetical protein
MAYYVVKGKAGLYDFDKNPNYASHPAEKMIRDTEKVYANFGFKPQEPMYTTGMKNPKLLEFLNYPRKHAVNLSTLTS